MFQKMLQGGSGGGGNNIKYVATYYAPPGYAMLTLFDGENLQSTVFTNTLSNDRITMNINSISLKKGKYRSYIIDSTHGSIKRQVNLDVTQEEMILISERDTANFRIIVAFE